MSDRVVAPRAPVPGDENPRLALARLMGRPENLARRQRTGITFLAVIAGMFCIGELLLWMGGGFGAHRWVVGPIALGLGGVLALIRRRGRPLGRPEGWTARAVLSFALLCGQAEAIVRPETWHSIWAIFATLSWPVFPWFLSIVRGSVEPSVRPDR